MLFYSSMGPVVMDARGCEADEVSKIAVLPRERRVSGRNLNDSLCCLILIFMRQI